MYPWLTNSRNTVGISFVPGAVKSSESFADQLFSPIPYQFAEAIRHFNISSVAIYHSGVITPDGTALFHPFVAELQGDSQFFGTFMFRLATRLWDGIAFPEHRQHPLCAVV
jgi:hypothetical protein